MFKMEAPLNERLSTRYVTSVSATTKIESLRKKTLAQPSHSKLGVRFSSVYTENMTGLTRARGESVRHGVLDDQIAIRLD
jgi:hypothetical protein